MRDIKFRAYDKENKEMLDVENLYWNEVTGEFLIRTTMYSDYFNTDEMILMQYTGLKDKNGKEIYEGDILKIPEWLWQDNQELCVCIYNEEHQTSEIIGFGLYIKDGYSGEYKIIVPSDEWDEFEVIGNIYDNPELLMKLNSTKQH